MLRRIAWAMGCLVGAVVFGVPLWIQTHRADLPDPGDADLVAAHGPMTGPNGFEELRAAAEAAHGLDDAEVHTRIDRMRKREAWEPELVEDLLRRYAGALAALERGISAPQAWIPNGSVISRDYEAVLDATLRFQLLVKLAACEAQLLARRGEHDRALERAQLGLHAGRRLSEMDAAHLLPMMVAVASQGIAVAELDALTQKAPMSPASARALATRVGSYRISPDAWQRVWATEYGMSKATILGTVYADQGVLLQEAFSEQLRSEQPTRWLRWVPSDYLFQPNRTLAAYAAHYREQQRKAGLSCRDAHVGGADLDETLHLRMLIEPNPTGSLHVAIISSAFDRFQLHRCHNEAKLALLQAAVALRAYAQAHGELPERLEALVPEYLDAVPLDGFDGAPLRYSKERGVVYSVGDDFADTAGAEATDLGRSAEPTIRVAL